MLKTKIKLLLQRLLGFENFLFLFSIITIKRLYMNKHEKEFVYFLSLLPEDDVLLDIGANIGIMSVPLARKASRGHVYAFEPMPQNLLTLKKIISHYKLKNITIIETALGDAAGELKMIMPIENGVKMQGLCHVEGIEEHGEFERFTVPVQRLDDIKAMQDAPKIAGIKIDVENFEYEVFTGAKELLLKHKPLIYCELWDNEKRKLTLDYMRDEIGYKVQVYDGAKLVPYSDQTGINFFLVP